LLLWLRQCHYAQQRREDLEQRQHKLDNATRISEGLEARFHPFTWHTII
jgi:hypothetical protein